MKFFQIEDYYKATATLQYSTPDDEPLPGPPPFTIRHKYVLGEYLVEEADFPTPEGGTKKIKHVLIQLGNTDDFLIYVFDNKINQLVLLTKIGVNKFSSAEVGLNDNGEEFSVIGSGIISQGLANGEFEFFENGMIIAKSKTTYEYE